mmetsp:Transcript_18650/g.34551  ORF Transcript_18650/g.34551 Transcript_18650/m.34551 type:complete len:81 (-) Transcript_18650:35-277(-)
MALCCFFASASYRMDPGTITWPLIIISRPTISSEVGGGIVVTDPIIYFGSTQSICYAMIQSMTTMRRGRLIPHKKLVRRE